MRERRRRRRTPAGGVQAEKQQRYLRLIAQGISNSEACRIVGINRKTGTRWRYGRTVVNAVGEALHYPAVKITEPKLRSPRYLSRRSGSRSPTCSAAARASARSRGSWGARRRRSVARSAATVTVTGAIGRIVLSRRHERGCAARGYGGSRSTRRWRGSWPGCWRSGGARSRSPMSCGCCSLASGGVGCVWSRSIRRSMTRPSSSRVPLAGAVVAVGWPGCSGAGGFPR